MRSSHSPCQESSGSHSTHCLLHSISLVALTLIWQVLCRARFTLFVSIFYVPGAAGGGLEDSIVVVRIARKEQVKGLSICSSAILSLGLPAFAACLLSVGGEDDEKVRDFGLHFQHFRQPVHYRHVAHMSHITR